jgi:hypothetical protein
VSELDGDDVIVLGLLNVLGLLKVLGVLDAVGLLDVLGLLSELRRPVGPVDKPEPRRRIGPPTLFRVLNPVEGGGVVTVNIDVEVGFCDMPVDEGAVASEETDEPDDEPGAQLTPGVIVGDALDGLNGLDGRD